MLRGTSLAFNSLNEEEDEKPCANNNANHKPSFQVTRVRDMVSATYNEAGLRSG